MLCSVFTGQSVQLQTTSALLLSMLPKHPAWPGLGLHFVILTLTLHGAWCQPMTSRGNPCP